MPIVLLTKIVVLIINALGFWLVYLVYTKNSKARSTRLFIGMTFLMFIWVDFAFMARLPSHFEYALLWIRIAWAITPFLFILIYFFVIDFIKIKKNKIVNYSLVLTGIIFLIITLFTDLIIKNISVENKILTIIYGELIFLFFGSIALFTILSFRLLVKKYCNCNKKEKKKVQYLLLGMCIFFIFNAIFNIFLPVFFNIVHLYEFGDYSTIFLLSLIAYAIVKQELFGIKTVLTTFFVTWTAISLTIDMLIFTESNLVRVFKIFTIIIFVYLGYFLVQSVEKEIKRRFQLERLTKELKKTNKDLKETLDAKSNFLTVASHQLHTPTSVIKGMLCMIMDESVPKDKKSNFIKRCAVQTDRLSNTIHDLLSSSAIEGKGFELNKKPTNIDELITKIVKERAIKLEQSNTQKKRNVKLIHKQPKISTPPINIDPNKIIEIVANLIDNAIQYTLKGKIEITTKTDDKNFIFTIKDTGIGIDKENMPKLFKKIARLPNAIQVCPDGTGLGLFIVKGMIEKHDGRVEMQSKGANNGSTFTFWLPL